MGHHARAIEKRIQRAQSRGECQHGSAVAHVEVFGLYGGGGLGQRRQQGGIDVGGDDPGTFSGASQGAGAANALGSGRDQYGLAV